MTKPDDQSPGPTSPSGDPPRRQQIPRPPDQRGVRPQADRPVKRTLPPKQQSRPHLVEPVDEKGDLPAADYRRTTQASPATTAVIPTVQDDSPKNAKPAARSARPDPRETRSTAPQSGRHASLRLVHVEPWSVTRLAFVVSVAMMIVAVVAVSVFWVVLNMTGVWGQINDSVTSVLSDDSGSFDIRDYLGFGRLVGLTLVLSAINVILMTALATIGAHLYNLAAQLLGGLEVTFSDD